MNLPAEYASHCLSDRVCGKSAEDWKNVMSASLLVVLWVSPLAEDFTGVGSGSGGCCRESEKAMVGRAVKCHIAHFDADIAPVCLQADVYPCQGMPEVQLERAGLLFRAHSHRNKQVSVAGADRV